MAFLFKCIFIFFLYHFLSLILNKCLLARIQEKTLLVLATYGRGRSNHSEVIIKSDILLMFGVFESCILK